MFPHRVHVSITAKYIEQVHQSNDFTEFNPALYLKEQLSNVRWLRVLVSGNTSEAACVELCDKLSEQLVPEKLKSVESLK